MLRGQNGGSTKTLHGPYPLCLIWSSYKVVWTRSSENYSFVRTCKLVTQTHVDVLEGKLKNLIASESKTCLKRGRPIGSKDSIPRKRKGIIYEKLGTLEEFTNMKGLNDET